MPPSRVYNKAKPVLDRHDRSSGGGRRLFEMLPARVELEILRVIDTPEATHIRYRVRR
jgi:hypothetical protein